jgi:hypothetical protein
VEPTSGVAALRFWKERLVRLGYEQLRGNYLGPPVQEFFDFDGVTYEAVTEAAWDSPRKRGGNLRLLLEVSVAEAPAPRQLWIENVIVAPDGSLVGEFPGLRPQDDLLIGDGLAEDRERYGIGLFDRVRIAASPETERRGYAGLEGDVFGETAPSLSRVEPVVGRSEADFALYVDFGDQVGGAWFAPELVQLIARPTLFRRLLDRLL